ncbi:hypothetical protein CRYPA_1843 [uncultured Candidatus Thioglobus sp.]|nr:hypothetical protein CRYPA_1843 [uncultured Candidatus Thioglobus sp.]
MGVIFLNEAWHWTIILGAVMTIIALIILNNIKINFYHKNQK